MYFVPSFTELIVKFLLYLVGWETLGMASKFCNPLDVECILDDFHEPVIDNIVWNPGHDWVLHIS